MNPHSGEIRKWPEIPTADRRKFIKLTEDEEGQLRPLPRRERVALMRNQQCPCGSGKKFKRCCIGHFER